ncbi:MAG TPA: DUF1579 domain-containing protein [Tahibacter sp.]|nr:DUF1579 domain-containing protein [Tahibacter sp.]
MTKTKTAALAAVLALASFGAGADDKKPAAAPAKSAEQQAMMEAWQRMSEVRPEHQQLKYFEGNWTNATKMWMDPSAPPQESSGEGSVASIYGGRYIVFKLQGQYMGAAFEGQGFMGFENVRNQYFSTWIDSMATGFWIAYGTYDAAKKTYTFHGEMPDPMKPGKKTKVRQLFRIVDDNHYVFEWYETHDGKEAKSMEITYTRK